MPEQALADEGLVRVAQEVNAFQSPTGPLGKLKQQEVDLRTKSRAVASQYNMPQDERQAAINDMIKKQQDNKHQQHLAIKYMEQQLAQHYGPMLAPRLKGRNVTVGTLDAMMRESFGITPPQPDEAAAQE